MASGEQIDTNSDSNREAGEPLISPDNAWAYLPPGMKSIDDPELDSLAKKLGFFYRAKEFKKFQDDLAAGATQEELIEQNPLLTIRIEEWKKLGLVE